jgi:hypothetical protein
MPLPEKLTDAIAAARAGVMSHELHDLTLGLRQGVWAALGPRDKDDRSGPRPGHRRRTALATISARKVIPIWERSWPGDDRLHRLLAAADRVVAGDRPDPAKRNESARLRAGLDDVLGLGGDLTPLYAAYSAGRAVVTALDDDDFDPAYLDPTLTDASRDAYNVDAAFWAATAAVGGSVWEPASSPARRRAFWEWWLDEAVPAAWQAV